MDHYYKSMYCVKPLYNIWVSTVWPRDVASNTERTHAYNISHTSATIRPTHSQTVALRMNEFVTCYRPIGQSVDVIFNQSRFA